MKYSLGNLSLFIWTIVITAFIYYAAHNEQQFTQMKNNPTRAIASEKESKCETSKN